MYGLLWGFPGSSAGKESACDEEDLSSIPGLGRSPGGGHGNPLQYSCLENLHGQRSLAGYSPWGHKESDMTEQLSTAQWRFGELNLGLLSCPVLALAKLTVDLEAWFISCSSLPYT